MEANEEATLVTLNTYRRFIDERIAEHRGRVFGSAGDSVIAEFASPVEAVRCGVVIQQELQSRNRGLPEDRQMRFRVGINLGDIMAEGENLYGDGVNIAARLEELAEPGGICVSGTAHDHITGKIEMPFEDAGEQAVKNISKPVRVFRWSADILGPATAVVETEGALPLPDKPSVAVLPFTNMSADSDQDFFADGIAEDIITELSKFHSLFIIARNSSFAFKGQPLDVKALSKKLGVRYVVEGSVRRAGNRVRITAQLIDALFDQHLWAEHYDRDLDDIFAVQDEVTRQIVTAIEPTVGSAERSRAHRKHPESLDAWESYQRGMWHLYRNTAEENSEAAKLFRRAIEIDPNFSPAHAGLAYALYLSVTQGFTSEPEPEAFLVKAHEAAQRAILLDPDDTFGHIAMGRIRQTRGEHEIALSAYENALGLNPNLAAAHYGLGFVLTYSGHPEEALRELDEAIRLSPRDPILWGFLMVKAQAFLFMESYAEALDWVHKALSHPNVGIWAYVTEVVVLAHLDRIEEARQALRRVMAIKPDFNMEFVTGTVQIERYVAGSGRYIDGLRKAGLPE
jgi:adenylate cyclase